VHVLVVSRLSHLPIHFIRPAHLIEWRFEQWRIASIYFPYSELSACRVRHVRYAVVNGAFSKCASPLLRSSRVITDKVRSQSLSVCLPEDVP
jgi:hypothetical protein